MKKTLLTLTLLLLAAQLAPAQKVDCQNDGPQRGNCEQPPETAYSAAEMSAAVPPSATAIAPGPLPTPPPAPGPVTSRFRPKTPTDHRFIINGGEGGEGLDTGCTYRSGGPLKFEIRIKRVVGETDENGKLKNPDALIENGIIKDGHVTLSMPAFDVDVHGSPSEVDVVTFNGENIGRLTGDNNVWNTNKFRIPIDKVNFGILDGNGGPAQEGVNKIEIHIDQASGSAQNWCTSIDWAELTFEAMYPVVLIHGNNSDASFWTAQGFVEPFKAAHIPHDATISLEPKAADIETQSTKLMPLIMQRAKRFGVDHLHIVTHSKGGLDVRDFLVRCVPQLNAMGEELGVLSLTTLSTPHHGSAGADYVLDAKDATILLGIQGSDDVNNARLALVMSRNDGFPNLRTSFVKEQFNRRNRPLPATMTVKGESKPVRYFSFGADANVNNSTDEEDGRPTIQDEELDGITAIYGWINISSIPGVTRLTQRVYRMMGTVSATYLERRPILGGSVWIVREELYRDGFRDNDFLVTTESAKHPRFTEKTVLDGNHSNISRSDVAERVIEVIRSVP